MDPPALPRPLVLLVDDDVRTAQTLARMLREDGYDVDYAADGAAAIARLTRDPIPDVLVTDMTMPLADGIAVTRYARSRRAKLPVFMVTGNPVLARRAPEASMPRFLLLTKPLDYELFLTQLRAAVTAQEEDAP